MVREYVDQVYIPAAVAMKRRSGQNGAVAAGLNAWHTTLSREWHKIRLENFCADEVEGGRRFRVEAFLGELNPDSVAVQLYADRVGDAEECSIPMVRNEMSIEGGRFSYEVIVETSRPVKDFTPRLIAQHSDTLIPLEDAHILWLR